MRQAQPLPVTLKHGKTWHSGHLPWELCNMLNALTQPDVRIITGGAVRKMEIDARSRAKKDNRLKIRRKTKKISTARRINKGLAMETVMSMLLTYVDHPRQVRSYCVTNRRGEPRHFAQGGDHPDILFRPADNEPSFQIACEVSGNKTMDDPTYLDQLERGLEHARSMHEKAGVAVTYLFVVNLREIGTDKALQTICREFIADPDNTLEPMGPIRLVTMRASELGMAVRRLHHEEKLVFNSRILAEALDALHETWWQEDLPEEEDWMAGIFLDAVRGGIADKGGLFDPDAGP